MLFWREPPERRLSDFPISIMFGGMGRPPLNVKPTVVRLPKGVAEQIDSIAGKKNRAKFIRAAIFNELKRLERKGKSKTNRRPT